MGGEREASWRPPGYWLAEINGQGAVLFLEMGRRGKRIKREEKRAPLPTPLPEYV